MNKQSPKKEKLPEENHGKYKLIFDSVFDGILIVNTKTKKIFSVNPSLCKMLGYTEEELIGKNFLFIHPKSEWKNILTKFKVMILGKSNILKNIPVLCKNGEIKYVDISSKNYQAEGRKYALGVFRDVTETKKVEEQSLAYREFLDSVPGFGFAKDINLNYVSANKTFCDLLKIPYDQIKGKTDFDIFPADLAKKYIEDDKKVIKTGENLLLQEITIDARTGKRFTVATRKHPWHDKNGKIIGLYGFGFDITEIKEAEDKLKESEEKYKLLSEKSKATMMLTLPDMTISYLSPNSLEVFGWKAEDLIGTKKYVFYSEDKEEVLKSISEVIGGKTIKNFRYRVLGEDSKIYWISHSANPIFENGKLIKIVSVITNIDEIIKAESVSQGYLERLNIAARAGRIGIWDWNIVEDHLFWDDTICEIYGVPHGFFKGGVMEWSKYIHPDDQARALKDLQAAERGEQEYAPEFRVIWPNGEIHNIKANSKTFFDKNGKAVRIVGTNIDITERKNREDELRNRNLILEQAEEISNTGSYVFDITNNIWKSSKVLDGIFGIDDKYERSFENWNKLIHEEDRKMMVDYFNEEVLGKHLQFDKEYRIIQKNTGNILWVHGRGVLKFDKNGNAVEMYGAIQDITDDKKEKENIERLAFIIENTLEGHAIFNSDANNKLVYVNAAWENITGYKRDEVINKEEPFMIKSLVNNSEQKKRILLSLKTGKTIQEEMEWTIKSGKKIFVDILCMPLNSSGGSHQWFNTVRDITSRKELDEAKSGFLSLASHQLRTPLSMTKWVLESILYKKNDLNENLLGKLNDLNYSNERLIKLVNNLLSVSSIDTGKLTVEKKNVNIGILLNNLSSSIKSFADSKNKIIDISISKELPILYCDPILIHEAVENLLTNAINYSEENSKIIKLRAETNKEGTLISVNNSGIIDEETQQKISSFDKFVRGENATEKQPAGSGLGLYITKKVIEADGGSVWFESNVETGTTFYIQIYKKSDKI